MTPAKRMRRLASVIAATALLAAGLAEPSRASHDPLPSSVQAVAFLVNGYGGCCIPGSVRAMLAALKDDAVDPLVAVHVSNWNHFDQGGNPGAFPFGGTPDPFTDESLVSKMSAEIAALPADTKVILIGHSFGADSILQVAKRVGDRRIAFLAVLDAVGRGGLRTNVTYPVPANVDFLFNRWQTNLPYPLENIAEPYSLRTGRLESRARESDQDAQNVRRTPKCKVKYLDPIGIFPELMLHAQMPKDSCIQSKLERILEGRIFNPNPRVVAADPVFGQSVLRLRGVVIRFSEPIDPATFGLADVVETPSTLVGIEGFPGIDDRVFVVRFNEIATPPAASPLRLTIGPDIRDLDGNPMDQDLDLVEGETPGDRYTFEYGLGGPTPPVELPTAEFAKVIWQAEGRLRIIVSVVVHFDRPLDRSIAVNLRNYSLISLGADRRLGTADDRAIALSAAAYDARTRAATLTLATPLSRREPLKLIVEGTGLRGYATTLALPNSKPYVTGLRTRTAPYGFRQPYWVAPVQWP